MWANLNGLMITENQNLEYKMAISRYCATQFKPKWIGYIYTLRNPTDGYIFYVGKTNDLKSRYFGHMSCGRNSLGAKGKYINYLFQTNRKPIIGIIEQIPIRTHYDSLYYDYKEFYWIKNYLEYGWELTNVRINDVINSEISYKRIIDTAKNGGGLTSNDFYYELDNKGFPIYDLKNIKYLGYSFSKEQFASHWAYLIDLDKYSNITESTLDYAYSDIDCEGNRNKNFEDYF